MKNFIVSDLHGNGNMYNIIINYLENIYQEDKNIKLYINGDLIDRGPDSADMLIDVKNRIDNNISFPIEYLAGNHELMMYQTSLRMKKNKWPFFSYWFLYNGGEMTVRGLRERLTIKEEKEIIDFVANLPIYHKFDEEIKGKKILLVHAKCPKKVEDNCNLKIKNNTLAISQYLWTRKIDPDLHFKNKLGNKDYFTIIGHTAVKSKYGYEYLKEDNCLNIDGGNASFVKGYEEYDHTPLIEIDEKNNRLVILTFNNNNEIIYGNYFDNDKNKTMSEHELSNYRKYIKNNSNSRKLTIK